MFKIQDKRQFQHQLKALLKTELLSAEIWQATAQDEFRPAAVLVPLLLLEDEIHVLLTRRSDELKHHSGQVSFPGGGFDQADLTIRQTAIRETYEEIGVTAQYIQVLGYLQPVKTLSGFCVTPFVAILQDGYEIKKNQHEVADVFSVPLSFFMNPDNCQKRSAKYQGKNVNYYIYPHQMHTIWGVTAEIIVKLVQKFS